MISLSTALMHSRQMFLPSGKGSFQILATQVQANCNLFLIQRLPLLNFNTLRNSKQQNYAHLGYFFLPGYVIAIDGKKVIS